MHHEDEKNKRADGATEYWNLSVSSAVIDAGKEL